ncbi:zinc finger protein 571-like [Toxorhynchites rutilus septentrionalis]|uniref:zinc finger protein 571-like n=1 Tax=Toxorhynchites rutilus septentrionalis TaxID=329112 RepID=UPI00247AF559|nr:zinc finger protein 571-like [Toxorhynchites rutilus septentrionalis]
MDIEELIEDQTTGQHCRLCLHWTDDTQQFVDIFRFNEDLNSTLGDKIRDCVGLSINPDDTVCKICSNCEQTIRLIDEFRILCHHSANLFESAQFHNSDVGKWECYKEHVTGLRVLVCEQRDRVDNILKEETQEDLSEASVDIVDNILPPEFIQVEEEETNEEQPEENIEVEPLLSIEHDWDPNESMSETTDVSENAKSRTINDKDVKLRLKLEIATELQTQMSKKPDLKAVSKKMNLKLRKVGNMWAEMKNYYRMYKKRAYAGHKPSIFRCRECPLFAVMDILVPKFYDSEPYREPEIGNDDDGKLISIDLKLAIAEEIKKHPELWDLSLNCSRQSVNTAWKEMTKKFAMDVKTLRAHWSRLRGIYRMFKISRLKGAKKREPTNEKYVRLMSILHEMLESRTHIPSYLGSITQQDIFTADIENAESQFIQKNPPCTPKEYGKCTDESYGDVLMDYSTNKKTTEYEDTEQSEDKAYPKRRFTGKRRFSDDGCIKVKVRGQTRYVKICELCGKQIERSRFEYHMNVHYGLRPYACSFEGCNRRYGSRKPRDTHEIVFHGEDGYIFQCDQCDAKFKQKAKYEYHYAIKHKSEKVPCKICGKVFKHRTLLRNHMVIHKTSYECHVCGKILQKKYSLSVHMRVHTNEKPYPCEVCGERFMLKVQMKTHLLKVHGIVLEEVQIATKAITS